MESTDLQWAVWQAGEAWEALVEGSWSRRALDKKTRQGENEEKHKQHIEYINPKSDPLLIVYTYNVAVGQKPHTC